MEQIKKSLDFISLSSQTIKHVILLENEQSLSNFSFVFRGFLKGFLLWGFPFVFVGRNLSHLRRSTALGIGVALVRVLTRLASNKKFVPEFRFKNAVIGLIAGTVFLLLDGKLHKNSVLVFWIMIRALYNITPSIPFGSTIVMCLSASQLLSSWISAPPSQLNKSYRSFLNWQGGILSDDISYFVKITPPLERHCFLVHPGLTCPDFLVKFFLDGLVRALRLYVPLHLMLLLTSQKKSFSYFIENLLRSCLFLSSYCTLAWMSACVYCAIYTDGITRKTLMLHTWVSGLAILIERPSRRTELAIYCLTYAMDSLYRWFKETDAGKGFKLPNRLLLVLSGAMLFHYHNNQPSFVMKWLMQLNDDNTTTMTSEKKSTQQHTTTSSQHTPKDTK